MIKLREPIAWELVNHVPVGIMCGEIIAVVHEYDSGVESHYERFQLIVHPVGATKAVWCESVAQAEARAEEMLLEFGNKIFIEGD